MHTKSRKSFAVVVGIVCSIAATLALAGEWSGKTTIGRIVVREDQTVLVYRVTGKWINPDLCDNDSRVVLPPPGAEGGTLAYREVYVSLLGAHLAKRKIKAFVKGCTSVGNQSYPTLVRVTIY
ncbi:MAG: hypothetical protein O7A03_05960 [Alphaproteobacteria bacterium]|nr:hypothetical protein [Alphaproteobacteria bacterium]